jgi:hypothetical protein
MDSYAWLEYFMGTEAGTRVAAMVEMVAEEVDGCFAEATV